MPVSVAYLRWSFAWSCLCWDRVGGQIVPDRAYLRHVVDAFLCCAAVAWWELGGRARFGDASGRLLSRIISYHYRVAIVTRRRLYCPYPTSLQSR